MGDGDTQVNGAADRLVAMRWALVAEAVEQLAGARSLESVIDILRGTARRIVSADGIAIVLRDGDLCHYIAEDAQAPLWAGQKFPVKTCVSGYAMTHNETVAIPDVYIDPRVPYDAYAVTFVRSMVMVPIGRPDPVAAVGAYWSETGQPSGNEIALLESLSRAAATALENGRLMASLEELNGALEKRVVERTTELEKAQEILRQSQKMEVIGQLTGNVAHDFNNLLSPIMASLDLVLSRGVSAPVVLRSAAVAMEAAESAKTLVQRLLAFARRQPLVPSAVDLRDLAQGMTNLLSSTLGPRIVLSTDIAPDVPFVKADRHQLEMAILNLAVNSRDAMPDGGSFTLSAHVPQGDERPDNLPIGDFVCVSVRDTGNGMDAATMRNAIEPFFSTKSAGHGTGLGLSMVDGLANQLGGALQISSTPGAGTQILLWLPVARSPRTSPTSADVGSAPQPNEGVILVIDDEPMVRKGTAEMLTALGYDVVQAETARAGLDLMEQGLKPLVVVTDHVMPGMTGAELALRLRVEHPETAVMIISGYQGIDLIAPDIVRLSKPFRQIHLAASIAAAREQVVAPQF
jgi:signal transduction histidine kinase/CheY-like chemotaxis protein